MDKIIVVISKKYIALFDVNNNYKFVNNNG